MLTNDVEMTYNWLELGEKTGTIVYTLQVSCVALPPQIYVSFWTYSFAKSLARILSLWCFLKHSSKRYACSMISFRMQMVFLWVRSGRNKQPVLCSLVMLRWFFCFFFTFCKLWSKFKAMQSISCKTDNVWNILYTIFKKTAELWRQTIRCQF